MKIHRSRKPCGTLLEKPKVNPAKEVLDDQGEIFSCGGVYLGLSRPSMPLQNKFEFLHLSNRRQETMVLNHRKLKRIAGRNSGDEDLPTKEGNSTRETLRRFFKESLN